MDRVPNNQDLGGIMKKNSTKKLYYEIPQFPIQTKIIKNMEIKT